MLWITLLVVIVCLLIIKCTYSFTVQEREKSTRRTRPNFPKVLPKVNTHGGDQKRYKIQRIAKNPT